MFTFGIFTTNLPYLVLLVFYAFFWICGIDKATSGEFQPEDQSLLPEKHIVTLTTHADFEVSFDYNHFSDVKIFTPDEIQGHFNLKKHKFKVSNTSQQLNLYFYAGLYNRPPPVIA